VPYIIRCRAADIRDVKAAARDAVLYRGDFPPWDADERGEWFDLSTDQVQLARNLFEGVRPWLVACYDGRRWLVPTTEGWRERAPTSEFGGQAVYPPDGPSCQSGPSEGGR